MIEREIESYWEKRKYDVCAWGVVLTASNVLNQIVNILKPKSFEERIIAPIYMIGSVVSMLNFILYFKRKSDFIF